MEKATGLFVRQTLFLNYVVKKLTARNILHNKKQLSASFNYFVKLNNIWMSYDLYNLNFSHYARNVCLLFYLVFFKYFYRYFFLGVHMGTQSDFSEGALSNSFA